MSRLVLLALALSGSASAADLDLIIQSDGVGPARVTLHDVQPGPLPSVLLPGAEGRTVRVDVALAESTVDGAPAYDLTFEVTRSTPAGRKRVHEEVARPVVRVLPDAEARVFMGGRQQVPGSDPAAWEPKDYFEVTARVRTEPEPG